MKATEHVAPEEVMAWVDEELEADAAEAVAAHVEECAECAGVAAGFRQLSEQIAEWRVPEVSERVEAAVLSAAETSGGGGGRRRRSAIRGGDRRWVWWTVGCGGAMAMLLVLVVAPVFREHEARQVDMIVPPQSEAAGSAPTVERYRSAAVAGLVDEQVAPAQSHAAALEAKDARAGGGGAPLSSAVDAAVAKATAPMIARSVSLTVQVQDVDVSRAVVETLLARHHGYAAQMNASTAEGSARAFTASLRIPAPELAAALRELRGLGHVENESQSGEEVTQQHQDLAARLKNSRETEARLQAILEQRTGRISDVLEVEQEISRVRGEIESMEAEQTALEHRVDFASVDLSLAEEFKAQFGVPSESVGTRLRNSFVDGFRNAGDMVLGFVLFSEEYGPAIVVWGMLLALPGIWVWRRYLRAQRAGY